MLTATHEGATPAEAKPVRTSGDTGLCAYVAVNCYHLPRRGVSPG